MSGSLGSQVHPIVDELGPIHELVQRGALCKGVPCNGDPYLVRPLVLRLKELPVSIHADFYAEAFDTVRQNDLSAT